SFMSSTESEFIQIKGRTARQGQNGTYTMVLCSSHLHNKFFTAELQAATEQTMPQVVAAIDKQINDAANAGTMGTLLFERQKVKSASKTKDRSQRKVNAHALDVESWKIVDRLLEGAPIEEQLRSLAAASLRQMAQPTLYITVLDTS